MPEEIKQQGATGAALCLRFDLDTFSTRYAFTKKVGWDEYKYLPRMLRVASTFGARLQFCACGQGLLEYPREVRALQEAGHAVDSHLHTHRVTLTDPAVRVAEELVCAEQAFRQERIAWTGIGATGMYAEGIDGHEDVQNLLQERGYRWCSTKFNLALPMEALQSYWLQEWLLEIPATGWSDMTWWYYPNQPEPIHEQNRVGEHTLEGFIAHTLSHLRRAAEQGLVYALDLHPGTLSKHDPDCEFLLAILSEAGRLNVPTVDMNQLYEWQLARRELQASGSTVTLRNYLDAEASWKEWGAQPTQPEKDMDYLAGWTTRPNVVRDGVSINRFGLRGADCLRSKPAGSQRVLCAGDSTVFGCAPDTAPWPAQLQARLNQSHPLEFEVLNSGINGFAMLNCLWRIRLLLRQLHPDIVLISLFANDLWAANPDDYPTLEGKPPPPFWIDGKSYAQTAQITRSAQGDWEHFIPPNLPMLFKEMIAACRQENALPILCTVAGLLPTPGRPLTAYQRQVMHHPAWITWEDAPAKMRLLYDRYNVAIRRVAEETHVPLIDVARYVDEHHDAELSRLFYDTCHALAEGNTVIAECVAHALPSLATPSR